MATCGDLVGEMKQVLVVVLALLLGCDALKLLLVFPVPSKSHTNLGEGYVRHLLNAGHEVTYITPIPVDHPPKNLRQIDVSSNFALFPASNMLHLAKLMNKNIPTVGFDQVLQVAVGFSNASVFHEDVQRLLHDPREEFDAVIAQWIFSELYCGIAAVFNCPLIWASAIEPNTLDLSLIAEEPNPAYIPSYKSNAAPLYDFKQRVGEFWMYMKIKYLKWLATQKESSFYEGAFSSAAAVRGHKLPSYFEARYNASLMFGNSHVSAGSALSLPQNYIPIDGFHIDENVKPLPEDLKSIMDNAKNGVIYFSMGSILNSKTMPDEMKSGLLDIFSKMKQTIIWKLEETPEKLPKNVHILGFAPQQSILAHPNCVLFIGHGGLLSNTETLHFGVPIIGIPVFSNQFLNIDRAVQNGYAKRVDLDHDLPLNLKAAIKDVLEDPKYRTRVAELSLAYHDRVTSPGRALAHWVQHVVRTRGAPHLRSPALLLPAYQKMYLDLMALIIILTIISYRILKLSIL